MSSSTHHNVFTMKKLFYVESDQVLRKSFELRLKESSWELYTLENMEEFSFRFEDFQASMLLLSDNFYRDEQVQKLLSTSQIPVGFVGFEKINNEEVKPLLKKPIDIMNLETLLDNFYEEFKK